MRKGTVREIKHVGEELPYLELKIIEENSRILLSFKQ